MGRPASSRKYTECSDQEVVFTSMMYVYKTICTIFILILGYSQIIAKQELPDAIRKDLASYVGCISGAIQIDQYRGILVAAGFQGNSFKPIVFLHTLMSSCSQFEQILSLRILGETLTSIVKLILLPFRPLDAVTLMHRVSHRGSSQSLTPTNM